GGAGLTVVAAPAPHDVAGGASETFLWSCVESGTSAGTLSVVAIASGTDANSGAVVSTTSPAAAATVQEGAALSIAVQTPSAVNRGQGFTISALITNTGGTVARAVQANAQAVGTGGAGASTPAVPAAQDIAAGATATLSFSYVENGTAPGTLTFQ